MNHTLYKPIGKSKGDLWRISLLDFDNIPAPLFSTNNLFLISYFVTWTINLGLFLLCGWRTGFLRVQQHRNRHWLLFWWELCCCGDTFRLQLWMIFLCCLTDRYCRSSQARADTAGHMLITDFCFFLCVINGTFETQLIKTLLQFNFEVLLSVWYWSTVEDPWQMLQSNFSCLLLSLFFLGGAI